MMNYYEILGVSRGAEASEISQTYRRLLQEKYQEMGKEADLPLLSQAHKTLTNPDKRREYDGKLDNLSGQFSVADPENPTRAEQSFLDGLKAFDLQNYQEAVQYFARAARLDPNQGHFFSQWGLSIGMFPGRLPEAELYCKKAIELDPDNPVFYFNLGFLYQRHNLSDAAQQSFAKAQEAQQVRQAKYSAQDSAAINAPWRGDAGSLLKELDSIEETMGQSDGEQPSVIALPRTEEDVQEKMAEEQQVPGPEASPEQPPVMAEETSDLSGIDDLLSELDSLESSMEKVETFNSGEIPAPTEPGESKLENALPQAEASVPENQAVEQPVPAAETEPVQTQIIAEEPADLPGVVDLLSELDSLESSMEKVETYQNGQTREQPGPEPAPELEIVTAQDEIAAQIPTEELQPLPDDQPEAAELEIVTVKDELAAQMPSGEPQPSQENQEEAGPTSTLEIVTVQEDLEPREKEEPAGPPESPMEEEHPEESTLDLLKELDSIESMVAGIEQSESEYQPEPAAEGQPEPAEASEAAAEASANELEDEALKLLQELDVPLDEPNPDSPRSKQRKKRLPLFSLPGRSLKKKSTNDDEIIKEKMERLNQMEEQMMEELLKLKAEREKLKADLKV